MSKACLKICCIYCCEWQSIRILIPTILILILISCPIEWHLVLDTGLEKFIINIIIIVIISNPCGSCFGLALLYAKFFLNFIILQRFSFLYIPLAGPGVLI